MSTAAATAAANNSHLHLGDASRNSERARRSEDLKIAKTASASRSRLRRAVWESDPGASEDY
jgi:hypothetical protein